LFASFSIGHVGLSEAGAWQEAGFGRSSDSWHWALLNGRWKGFSGGLQTSSQIWNAKQTLQLSLKTERRIGWQKGRWRRGALKNREGCGCTVRNGEGLIGRKGMLCVWNIVCGGGI